MKAALVIRPGDTLLKPILVQCCVGVGLESSTRIYSEQLLIKHGGTTKRGTLTLCVADALGYDTC